MVSQKTRRVQKPRELRRRVVVPARLRDGRSWTDTCILNVSSRGLMIQTSRPLVEGSDVEVRCGEHVIRARVMWRDGARTGLRSQQLVPMDEIMTIGQATALQLTAAGSPSDRRRDDRGADENRLRGRAYEFAGTIIIATVLAAATLSIVGEAFARPVAIVTSVLGG